MAGIRGHSVWEGLLPLLLLFIVAALMLRGHPNGWLIAVALPASFAVIALLLSAIRTIRYRLRYADLVMLRDLALAPPAEQSMRAANKLAQRILHAEKGAYRAELEGMTSFVDAARQSSDGARLCRLVLFRHAPWSTALERDVAAMRYQLIEGEHAAWLEWFLTARVGWPEFADRVADVTMYALPHIPAPERQRLLIRVLTKAAPRESWRRFGQLYEADLRAIDPAVLTSYQRSQIATVLGEEAPA